MSSPTLERVLALVREAAGLAPADPLDPETPLVDGGVWLDSVTALRLLVTLEKEFAVELPADELRQSNAMASAASLARFIDAKRQQKRS